MLSNLLDKTKALLGNASTKHMPPMLPGGLPLIGHIWDFQREPIDTLHRGVRQFGEAFSMRLLNSPAVVFSGPEAHERYFNARPDQLSPKEIYKIMTPIFGRGIAYDTTPEMMREQVGFIIPALKPRSMKTYAEIFHEEAELYFDKWGDEGEVDILDMAVELTTYTSSRCLLGAEFRDGLTIEFGQLYQDMEAGLHPLGFFYPNLPIPSFIKRDKARARIVELLNGIIENRRRQNQNGGEKKTDPLQALLDATYKDGRTLTDHEIIGILITMVFAGHHTSSVLGAWFGIQLLQHPRYVERLVKEQQRVYGDGDRRVSFDSLRELEMMERSIQETARMYPPLVVLMRKVLRDFQYKQWTIPAGAVAITSPAVSHRLPHIFKDPNRYDPDRFSPERAEDRKHVYNLITFGGGPSRCIGQQFSYMQTKAIWSVLLRKFDLELASPIYVPNYDFLVVGPRHPALLRYKRKRKAIVDVPRAISSQPAAAAAN